MPEGREPASRVSYNIGSRKTAPKPVFLFDTDCIIALMTTDLIDAIIEITQETRGESDEQGGRDADNRQDSLQNCILCS